MAYVFGGGGGDTPGDKKVAVQRENQKEHPVRADKKKKKYYDYVERETLYPGYRAWWHAPATWISVGLTAFFVLLLVFRLFFVPEYRQTDGDRFLSFCLYVFMGLLFFSGSLYAVSFAAMFAMKHIQNAFIYVFPNGIPVTYRVIREQIDAMFVGEKPGYYEVQLEQARRDLVSPAEFHYTNAPQETYAPSSMGGGISTSGGGEPASDEEVLTSMLSDEPPADKTARLPKMVNLFDLLDQRENGHIVIGVDEARDTIQIRIQEMFHHLVGGQSGTGKSVYLRGLVYQLVREAEDGNIPLQIALADIENSTFPEFRGVRHVRWYAGNDLEVDQLTDSLLKEVERRRELYEAFKGATPKTIERYNALAERQNIPKLPIIVAFYDEFTAFMSSAKSEQKKIAANVMSLALRARKYGIFLVISGQSFKSDLIDSAITGQFGFNVCFRVRTSTQSMSVIGASGAQDLTQPGEVLMKTKSGDIIHLQTPFVDDDVLQDALVDLYDEDSLNPTVPDIVREIVSKAHNEHEDKVQIKVFEPYFRMYGVSRGDLMKNLKWMDDHGFIVRNDKNGRELHWDVIETFGLLKKDIERVEEE